MKTNRKSLAVNCFNTLVLAVIIGILTAIAAKAQDHLNFELLNGLFTPTESERFFQAGREDFEREIAILNHPERYLSGDVLQIDPKIIKQMNQLELPSDFEGDLSEYKLQKIR